MQGFEFDYIGVIWGLDLILRSGQWIPQKNKSFDSNIRRASDEKALTLLKNAYCVLSSRGINGCFLTVLDKETREYLLEIL